MSALAVVLQLSSVIFLVVAMLQPRHRRACAVWLALVGAVCASFWLGGADGSRSLEISHFITAFEGNDPALRASPVETVEAPAGRWGLLGMSFCLGWAVWALLCAGRGPSRAFGAPLALAWSGMALQLLLQKAAAPGPLLWPFDLSLDRFCLPAAIAGALLLGKPRRKIVEFVLYLSLLVAAVRMPVLLTSTWATQEGWGTHLDVHRSTTYVPPATAGQKTTYVVREPGSDEQLRDLVWAPHLFLFPVMYLLSAGGIGFLGLMAARQRLHNAGQLGD